MIYTVTFSRRHAIDHDDIESRNVVFTDKDRASRAVYDQIDLRMDSGVLSEDVVDPQELNYWSTEWDSGWLPVRIGRGEKELRWQIVATEETVRA